ncbi:hypothetical protein OS175_10220 [Marinicella sp. S1101]|jgi:hypothetical protein|uniref:hypothetical protein n=1 Tax=Marinicella marina TaxID=2996016 RepID=UPI002260D710|nr:hypothetical protein [Marinicella marina]MCX7554255.1 hypothetical protein [Marinicella marina]
MSKELDKKEFFNFRCAHSKAISFIQGVLFMFALIFGVYNQYFGQKIEFSFLYLIGVFTILLIPVPYFGYKLARFITFRWYSESFGSTYSEYRRIERLVENNNI